MRDCVFSSFVLWFECALKRDVYPKLSDETQESKMTKKSNYVIVKKTSNIFENSILENVLSEKKWQLGWGFSTFPRWRNRLFLNRTSLTPHQIFDAHLLENTDLSPSRFHFSVSFILRSCFESDGFIAYSNEWDWREKTMFIHTNQPLITSFYIKKVPNFCRISDKPAVIRNFLRNGRVRR